MTNGNHSSTFLFEFTVASSEVVYGLFVMVMLNVIEHEDGNVETKVQKNM